MKKIYIQPQGDVINVEMCNGILAGSENVNISKTPVDHFDTNKKTGGKSPIWN